MVVTTMIINIPKVVTLVGIVTDTSDSQWKKASVSS